MHALTRALTLSAGNSLVAGNSVQMARVMLARILAVFTLLVELLLAPATRQPRATSRCVHPARAHGCAALVTNPPTCVYCAYWCVHPRLCANCGAT
jgi:hypothetical protein